MPDPSLPLIIQGVMGVGVSGWMLAQAVARTGQLGVVSGVALDAVLARRLQLGDPGGYLREALAHFPGGAPPRGSCRPTTSRAASRRAPRSARYPGWPCGRTAGGTR